MTNNGSELTARIVVAGLTMTAVTLFATSAGSSDLNTLRTVEAAAAAIIKGNPDPQSLARSREILNEAGFVKSLMSSDVKGQPEIGNTDALSTYLDPQAQPYADAIFDPAARNAALFQSMKLNEQLEYMTMADFSAVADTWQATNPESQRTGWTATPFPYAINGQPVVRYDRSFNGRQSTEWGVAGKPDWAVPDELARASAEFMEKFFDPEVRAKMTDGEEAGEFNQSFVESLAENGNTIFRGHLTGDVNTSDEPDCTLLPGTENCFAPAIAIHDNNETTCSGTLIGAEWVLAASHCFCRLDPTHVTLGSRVYDDGAVVTSPAFTVGFAGTVKHHDPEFCTRYNGPDEQSAYTAPDLALVKLARPLQHPTKQLAAVLGTSALLNQINLAEMVGFGATEYNDEGGKKLVVSVMIASKDCAGASDVEQYKCLAGRELVAIDPNGKKDSCNGDSGGGVYARLENGNIALLAVVSRGTRNSCGAGGIYVLTTTDDIRNWLAKHVPDIRIAEPQVELAADLRALNAPENN
ncbi:trypsin-like serine protease [uncultured Hoeflea sp.]|uniref:S1 family peptidase n=1 Tax=uncultured Hoeflea sp. TaxID=538666 RepID=UPI0030EE0317|tara:strand:+ start:154913 stop:156487 length:1575 start_codon:yes stop_codon:yes gene_type:complete